MRAVVLDADPVARALVIEALGRAGHEVEATGDGQAALGLLGGESVPDLAVLDWRAQAVDGVELCRRLRRLGPRAPYLMLTAAPDEMDAAAAALAVGADDLLRKPLRLDELELRLRLASRAQAARKEVLSLRAEVTQRSRVDQLTGLEDRQAILQRLDGELSRAARTSTPLSALLVDIDQFRNINDVFGHEAGDAVLTNVAARIRRALRRYDSLGRWGAEEFLVLLPGCAAEHTEVLTQRLLQTISAEPVPTGQGRVAVTCSAGALCLPFGPTDAAPDSEEVTIALERAAGEAKQAGGNQAIVYSLEPGAMGAA